MDFPLNPRGPGGDERELLLRLAARRMDPAILERLVGEDVEGVDRAIATKATANKQTARRREH